MGQGLPIRGLRWGTASGVCVGGLHRGSALGVALTGAKGGCLSESAVGYRRVMILAWAGRIRALAAYPAAGCRVGPRPARVRAV